MTDEQIIKVFEEILKNRNNKLSLIEQAVCADVLSLINCQKAELEAYRATMQSPAGIRRMQEEFYQLAVKNNELEKQILMLKGE